jgi:hypothetical protein
MRGQQRHKGDKEMSGMGAEGAHLMPESFDQVVLVVYKRKGADVVHQVECFGGDHEV